MEKINFNKSTLVKLAILGLFMVVSYQLTTAPRIFCRIPCTTCPGGIIDQDFTKEATSIKGREVTLLTSEKKTLKFWDCYALKKEFFTRRYHKVEDLNWTRWF
jgi:hypothetical protein